MLKREVQSDIVKIVCKFFFCEVNVIYNDIVYVVEKVFVIDSMGQNFSKYKIKVYIINQIVTYKIRMFFYCDKK